MNRAAVVLMVCAAVLAGCSRREPPDAVDAAAADASAGGPLEQRPRNASEYEPMFPDQTRAPGAASNIELDVQVVAKGLSLPFAVEPLPRRAPAGLREDRAAADHRSRTAGFPRPVDGLPAIHFSGQAGLLDVALDPDFANNHAIYFSYSELLPGGSGLALARARLVETGQAARLEDLKVIFRSVPLIDSDRQTGSRIAFARDGKLLLTVGERGVDDAVGQAQNLRSHFGKIVRLNPDGTIPRDNPFVGRTNVLPEILSYGHRNSQSLAVDAATGKILVH